MRCEGRSSIGVIVFGKASFGALLVYFKLRLFSPLPLVTLLCSVDGCGTGLPGCRFRAYAISYMVGYFKENALVCEGL